MKIFKLGTHVPVRYTLFPCHVSQRGHPGGLPLTLIFLKLLLIAGTFTPASYHPASLD